MKGKIKQKKSLGQVFIKTKEPLYKIAQLLKKNKAKYVIEIGPGAGVLTSVLLNSGFKVLAIELDSRFAHTLISNLIPTVSVDNLENLKVINSSFLNIDLNDVFKDDLFNNCKLNNIALCGNIPYNISTLIMNKTLSVITNINCAIFMTQKEFAQRVCSDFNKKSYGSLSVYTQLRAKTLYEFEISRSDFSPVPKVDSAVIQILKRSPKLEQRILDNTEKITKLAFSQRRKKLSNSISLLLAEIDKSRIAQCPVDLSLRAEALKVDDFITLSNFLFCD